MLVKITHEESIYVTVTMLREAYINCIKLSKHSKTSSEDKEKYLDMTVGFPIVLKYFLDNSEYFNLMEQIEDELSN